VFTNPQGPTGKVVNNDDIYKKVIGEFEAVLRGIDNGELDLKYIKGGTPTEGAMSTSFKFNSYDGTGPMNFRDRFVITGSTQRIKDLMHEFGRRWGQQKGDFSNPGEPFVHDVDAGWDLYIPKILSNMDSLLTSLNRAHAAKVRDTENATKASGG